MIRSTSTQGHGKKSNDERDVSPGVVQLYIVPRYDIQRTCTGPGISNIHIIHTRQRFYLPVDYILQTVLYCTGLTQYDVMWRGRWRLQIIIRISYKVWHTIVQVYSVCQNLWIDSCENISIIGSCGVLEYRSVNVVHRQIWTYGIITKRERFVRVHLHDI